jgi:predicted small lipoprotein YifL
MKLAYTRAMRVPPLIAATLLTACGQTGDLYLPDESVQTPVEIRGPEDKQEDEKKKPDQPPGS